jgi:endoglycosylceramidase
MARITRSLLRYALLLAATGCSRDTGADTGADTGDGTGADSGSGEDSGADTGSGEDSGSGEDTGTDLGPDMTPPYEPEASWPFALRPLSTRDDLRIVDDRGRDTLLRGVNITSLGEYWQGNPDSPPTLETTDADWDEMAASGVSVIRLVVHWSRIEPQRGVIDEGYLDRIESYVEAAARRGIHTVIDMHQDAYSAFISTPPGEICPEGTTPAKGWDGAPAWAVFTDGASTCISGDRNSSPAVRNAWNAFYDNRDGIRDRFVASWAAVAARFAGRPEVAGYDLLNEPEVSRPAALLAPLYNDLLGATVSAIRTAESGAPFDHLLFIEPAIPAGDPSFGVVVPSRSAIGVPLANVVSAPHNYAESIALGGAALTIELANQLYLNAARTLRMPTWIGEYGFWDTSDSTLEKVGRYAADEDRRLLHGAWWQWRQPCGDPHSIGPTGEFEVVHLHTVGCPGDVDRGPTTPFMRVLSRGFARAAPGRLTRIENDLETGSTRIEGDAMATPGELVVWTPTPESTHAVELTGLRNLRSFVVGGGRVLVAEVESPAAYALSVAPR